MNNIKSYLEVESESHVQDTATSLGLSLSPYMTNEHDPIIRTMMNAIFDRGYYKEMRLVDVDGKSLVTLSNNKQIAGVPQWLIKLMPMKVATEQSEISSGWTISGTLFVTANPTYGYLKLYEQGKATLIYSFIIFLGAITLLVLVLRFTLKSLKNIEKQANDIASGQFTTIKQLPWTLEVKNVAQSMNSMSHKISNMIARLNSKLGLLTDTIKRDSLTSLFNQTTFNENLRQTLSSVQSGYAVLIKFDDLTSIAKDQGNDVVNVLLQDLAQSLIKIEYANVNAYRLYGSEFALICPLLDSHQIVELANILKQKITDITDRYNLGDAIHIGIIHFDRGSEFKKLSESMVEAYEQAKNIGVNEYFIQQQSVSSMSEQDWKASIVSVIENNTAEIILTSDAYNYSANEPEKVMEEAFTTVKDVNGDTLSIGTFFSMAREFGLEEELDKCIVNKIILLMESKQQRSPVTINLSMTSVLSNSFKSWLQARLNKSQINANLMVFSVTAYSAAKDLNAFSNFSTFMHSLGAKTLLKRYSSDVIPLDLLKELHIDYIRLGRDLTNDISNNKTKSELLDIMQEVANLLNIKVIAEGVSNDIDFDIVKATPIYGIGR